VGVHNETDVIAGCRPTRKKNENKKQDEKKKRDFSFLRQKKLQVLGKKERRQTGGNGGREICVGLPVDEGFRWARKKSMQGPKPEKKTGGWKPLSQIDPRAGYKKESMGGTKTNRELGRGPSNSRSLLER